MNPNDVPYNDILLGAAKWPELRIAYWKEFKRRMSENVIPMKKLIKNFCVNGVHYKLSDDLVYAITKLSLEVEPAVLMEHATSVRMPFSHMIFEWDILARQRSYQAFGAEIVEASVKPAPGERPAMLVLSEGGALSITDVTYINKDLMIFPVWYIIDPNHNKRGLLDLARQGSGHTYLLAREVVHGQVLTTYTQWWLTTAICLKYPEQAKQIEMDDRFLAFLNGPLVAKADQIDDPLKRRAVLINGTAGNPRWFGALCLLINQPNIIRYIDRLPAVPSDAQRRPSSGVRELTLFLPKEKVVSRVLGRLKRAERKQVGAHAVAGHWAYSHRSCDPNCNHQWPLQHSRRQICSKCGGLRWFKENFTRGKGPLGPKRARYVDFQGTDLKKLEDHITNAARSQPEEPEGSSDSNKT